MMDKRALGDSGGGIIHIMFNEDGWQRCASFIGEVQFVVNYWLTHHGFSCGIGDTVADPGTMAKIAQLIQDAKQSVQEIIKQYQGGALEEKPGRCAPLVSGLMVVMHALCGQWPAIVSRVCWQHFLRAISAAVPHALRGLPLGGAL